MNTDSGHTVQSITEKTYSYDDMYICIMCVCVGVCVRACVRASGGEADSIVLCTYITWHR